MARSSRATTAPIAVRPRSGYRRERLKCLDDDSLNRLGESSHCRCKRETRLLALAGGSAGKLAILAAVSAALKPGFVSAAEADPQATPPPAADPQSSDQTQGDNDDDPTRPINSFDLRYRFENDSTTSQNDKQFLTYRVNSRITLDSQWKLGLRADLPVTASNAVSATNPNGAYAYGVGPPRFQAYLANVIDDRWAYAFGSK